MSKMLSLTFFLPSGPDMVLLMVILDRIMFLIGWAFFVLLQGKVCLDLYEMAFVSLSLLISSPFSTSGQTPDCYPPNGLAQSQGLQPRARAL